MNAVMITSKQRQTLARLLAEFAEHIVRVDVFGSRATGRARPNSDIDLVIHGDLDAKSERRLWTDFEESDLAVSVDIIVYARIKNDSLRDHIDAVAEPLFTQAELRQERNRARGHR